MKRSILFILSLVAALNYAYSAHKPDTNAFGTNDRVTDFIGIFYGTEGARLNWTVNEWTPYVVHTFQNGEKKWLFQGFSFLEFKINKKSFIHSKKHEPATKAEWERLIDLLFVNDRCLDALDQTISYYKNIIGNPPFRHKITIAIPMPIKGQTNWGSIGGKKMNFNDENDRIKAIKWYIDRFLSEYKKHKYENFDFEGFYWMEEDMEQTRGLAVQISHYIHQLGYDHYWKPYLSASGSTYWDECNFDYCYLQAGGYCIKESRGFERVGMALDKAKRRGMGLLFEFEINLFSKPETYIPRINKCIDTFEQNGVYEQAAMSYYDAAISIYAIANGGFRKLSLSSYYLNQARNFMDRIANHIVERYTRAYGPINTNSNNSSNNSSNINNSNNNNTSSGSSSDWRNPDYWHF